MQARAEPVDWQVDCRERVEAVLRRVLPDEGSEPARLHQAMRYAALGEGKRIRPLLVYAAGAAFGVGRDALDAPAAAVELIHAYSLVPVARAPCDALDAREVGIVVQRDPEVDQPEVAVRRQHQVARLDIAVDHAARMRVVQRLGALEHQRQHVLDRQQVVGARVGGEGARAVDELRDDPVVAALLARVVDRHDVRVLKHPDHVRL